MDLSENFGAPSHCFAAGACSNSVLIRGKVGTEEITALNGDCTCNDPVEALAHGYGSDAAIVLSLSNKTRASQEGSEGGRGTARSNKRAKLAKFGESVAVEKQVAKMLKSHATRASTRKARRST